jgi:hypothetical protein
MVFSNFIIFATALCFVMGLALAVGNPKEICKDVGPDVDPSDLSEKRRGLFKILQEKRILWQEGHDRRR